MNKKEIRRTVRERKRQMSEAEIASRSERLAELFLASEVYRNAKSVYGYLPYNQEVRTVPILEQALRDGKQVAVPKVYGKEMRFILLSDLSQVAPGCMGISEPTEDGPIADDPHALVLMPGVAFDAQGHRIGYGGGYYDRFLAAEPEHPTLALCYDFQVFPELETEEYDIPVNQVLWV